MFKQKLSFVIILFILLSLILPFNSFGVDEYIWSSPSEIPVSASANNFDLKLESGAGILIDQKTGEVLYEHNSHEQLRPASVTKIMTLLLIMEAIDSGKLSLEDKIPCSQNAAAMGGSQIWLDVREELTVHEMLKAICVVSANDCTMAMAEYLAGSEEAAHVVLDAGDLLLLGVVGRGEFLQQVAVALIEVDHALGVEAAGLEELDGGLHVEEQEGRLGLTLVLPDDELHAVVQGLGIILDIVEHILSHVVVGGHGVLGIVLGARLVERQQGIDQRSTVRGVVAGLGDEAADQRGAVDKHVLVGRRRAELVGVAPAGKRLVIILLLEVLLVEGKVGDALRAVRAVLALGEPVGRQEHRGDGQNDRN